jgi:hypothetical protein
MKKTLVFDIAFIILLGIFLTFLCESGRLAIPTKFLFIPLLAAYYIGRYVTVVAYKKKE